ncbi:MAG: LamG-like jellyroll fold domain-containing protein, partial [Cyanobacteria bacterium J06555_13]
GTLQRREIILQTDQRGRALANIYAHYVKEGAVIPEGIPTEGGVPVAPGPERVVTEGVVTEGGITESVVTEGSGTEGIGAEGIGTEGIGTEATEGLVTEGATTLTTGLGSLQWTNYFYAGRFRMTDERASVGVTFLSRHPEKIDQYYRLGRKPGQPFVLSAYPSGVQTVKSADPEQDQRLTDITPVSNVWYHFLVRVENEEDRTVIQAKVWQEGEVEPADFQINAYDDNPDIRITSGTVGLWSQGQSQGIRQFDNLRVWPISVAAPTPADLLLDINFEAPSQIPEPEMWQDSGDRITPLATRQGENGQAPEPLFKLINIDGAQSVFGTESTLNNIHAHYTNADADVLSWQNYTFAGQLQITQKGSAIGVTFLSRYPETLAQEDYRPTHQYYSLRRDAQHPTFYLMAAPESVQSVVSLNPQQTPSPGQLDSGIEPDINTWYRFSISVVDNQREQRTEIRAKVWKASEPEPEAYQIVAHDSSSIRLRTGTVGVWTSGRGAKYFDRLVVAQDVLLSERFESYAADQDPKDWFDTNQRNSAEEDNSLFKTAEVAVADQSTLAFGTRSNRVNIHTHYTGAGALAWKNYVYTGRLLTTDEKASLGLTFLSRYSNESDESGLHDVYYRLRSSARNSTFHIAPHPQTNDYDIKGQTDSTIRPQPNTWYRFRIEEEDTGTQTNIRANVWPEGEPEPTNFQIDAYDDSESRLTEGTVGLWTAQQGGGSHGKYFDDLLVTHGFLLSTTIRPDLWSDAPARDRFILRPDFFTAIDAQDNPLQLVSSDTLPLRNPPLSKKALAFDGKQQCLASKLTPEQSFSDITLEAWIHPDFDNASSTLISLMGRKGEAIADADNSADDGENNLLEWGLDESNQLTLTVMGQTFTSNLPLSTIEFTHVALRIEGVRVTFIVNGDPTPFATAESPPAETPPAETLLDAEISAEAMPAETPSTENGLLSQPLSIIVTNLILARDQSATKYFKGKINDIRIWTVVRTSEQISIGRQQQPDVRAAELLGYWQLGERWPQERSLQGARSFAVPNLAKPDQAIRVEATLTPGLPPVPQSLIGIELSDSGFWRSQRPVMMLNGSQSVQFVDEQPPEDRQQQTIEVWFQVTDKNISARKQVIYHEGNGQQGLVLYVYDGELYFVGYNLPAAGEAATESQWPIDYAENWWINPTDLRRVWRLKSDRIESGRWHHTAIVLDGRDEVRPESLRGYIDGKLAVVGPGSKLWQHQRSFRIGQANAERVQFHDGPADGAAHRLQGGILQVRLWNSARTSQQIAENWSTDILETGIDRNNLMLMWDFAAVTEM